MKASSEIKLLMTAIVHRAFYYGFLLNVKGWCIECIEAYCIIQGTISYISVGRNDILLNAQQDLCRSYKETFL